MSSGSGARPESGWVSARWIRIAALSVISSPEGSTSAGTWRSGLTLAISAAAAGSSQTRRSISS
jgi:hypothetical protein